MVNTRRSIKKTWMILYKNVLKIRRRSFMNEFKVELGKLFESGKLEFNVFIEQKKDALVKASQELESTQKRIKNMSSYCRRRINCWKIPISTSVLISMTWNNIQGGKIYECMACPLKKTNPVEKF